jgi:hypothetical protein
MGRRLPFHGWADLAGGLVVVYMTQLIPAGTPDDPCTRLSGHREVSRF